jgi:glutathione S-transferase
MSENSIKVHYWPTPNGKKITIALEELGLPYEIILVNIGAGEQFKPEFLAISPNNRMPAIVDPQGPDGAELSVFESGAILQYLARKTNALYGASERDRVEIDQWVHWQIGGLGPMSGQANHFRNYAPRMVEDAKQLEYGIARYTNEVNRLYGVLERRLADRDFIAGAYSIADIASWPWIVGHKAFGQDLEAFPKLQAWFERVGARPAVQRGIEVGKDAPKTTLADDTPEAEAARRLLFGQTAKRD